MQSPLHLKLHPARNHKNILALASLELEECVEI